MLHCTQMQIVETGPIESEQHLEEIVQRLTAKGAGEAVIPEDDDADCSHYWYLEFPDDTDDHRHVIYVGTPASFELWLKSRIQ